MNAGRNASGQGSGERTRGRGGALLAMLCLYGIGLVAVGVLGAIGFGTPSRPSSAAAGDVPPDRFAQSGPAAPAGTPTTAGAVPTVLTPRGEGASRSAGERPASTTTGRTPGGQVPSASVGTDVSVAPAVFVPARVVLPDGSAAPVLPVGLRSDGSLVIPDDVRAVGWWTGGSKAGEVFGSVVIAGHVDSATRGIGVFAELKHLAAGQVVMLDSGGQQARYRIFSVTRVPQAEISQAAGIFAVDGEARLVLITCGGPFDPARHRYQDNLVVVATPLA